VLCRRPRLHVGATWTRNRRAWTRCWRVCRGISRRDPFLPRGATARPCCAGPRVDMLLNRRQRHAGGNLDSARKSSSLAGVATCAGTAPRTGISCAAVPGTSAGLQRALSFVSFPAGTSPWCGHLVLKPLRRSAVRRACSNAASVLARFMEIVRTLGISARR
jgi:hypothetical protein